MSPSTPLNRRKKKIMGKPQTTTRTLSRERRKFRRFPLHYSVRLKFRHQGSSRELQTVSQDISVRGILVKADSPIPLRADVGFVVTVQEDYIVRPIRLVGEGVVVRVEPDRGGEGFAIALECRRSIYEKKNSLIAFPG